MRQTKKLVSARQKAIDIKLIRLGENVENQEWLYQKLNESGIFWDSKQNKWVSFSKEPANAPTPLIRVRVWGATGQHLDEAIMMVKGAFGNGFELVNQSLPYVCRPRVFGV